MKIIQTATRNPYTTHIDLHEHIIRKKKLEQ